MVQRNSPHTVLFGSTSRQPSHMCLSEQLGNPSNVSSICTFPRQAPQKVKPSASTKSNHPQNGLASEETPRKLRAIDFPWALALVPHLHQRRRIHLAWSATERWGLIKSLQNGGKKTKSRSLKGKGHSSPKWVKLKLFKDEKVFKTGEPANWGQGLKTQILYQGWATLFQITSFLGCP